MANSQSDNTLSDPSQNCVLIKSETPLDFIEYVEYNANTGGLVPINIPNTAPTEDIFTDPYYELHSDIKVEPIDHDLQKVFQCDDYTCPYCSMNFASRIQLNYHLVIHLGTDVILCSNCDFKCSSQENLDAHVKPLANDRQLICVACKEEFLSKCDLYNHMKGHQLGTTVKPADGFPSIVTCPNCDYKCSATGFEYNEHLKQLDVDSVVKCFICSHVFLQKCEYFVHMRAHAREKCTAMPKY